MKAPWILILSLILLTSPALSAERQLLDQVVAVVNDEPITQSELDIILRPLYEQYKTELKGERLVEALSEARQKLLNQLIEDKLVFQEAKAQKIEVDDSELEKQIEEFKKRFTNEDELEQALKNEGLNLSDMRERIHRQEMVRKIQDMEIRSKVVVSPLEIQEYYEKNASEFSSQEKIRVRSMTIKKSSEAREKGLTDEAAKNRVEDLRKKILGGVDFGKLAKENSEDSSGKTEGIGDWVQRGEMIPVIDELIFKLPEGEVSQIIETPMGYHFFRVEEKQASKKKNFAEARDEIYGRIFNEKARKRFEEWTEELKRKSYISLR